MAYRAMTAQDPSPVSREGSLAAQTRSLLKTFDAEHQDAAFNDSGDGTRYARWLADMLDCWLMRYAEMEEAREAWRV